MRKSSSGSSEGITGYHIYLCRERSRSLVGEVTRSELSPLPGQPWQPESPWCDSQPVPWTHSYPRSLAMSQASFCVWMTLHSLPLTSPCSWAAFSCLEQVPFLNQYYLLRATVQVCHRDPTKSPYSLEDTGSAFSPLRTSCGCCQRG